MSRSTAMASDRGKPFELNRKWTAAQQIYADLRERIIGLELPPGTTISRAELANFYGVSPTPLRDAMLKLEQEGLLEIFPQSKTLITKIDIANARETQFLRNAIEMEVARALAENPDAPLDVPRRILAEQATCSTDADGVAAFADLDRKFHRSLCAAAGHEALWDLVLHRSGHLDRLRRLHLPTAGKAELILENHWAILDAITAGDPDRAKAEVRRHLGGTLQAVNQIVEEHPEYF